ncbi:MAG: hypothetical protein INR66_12735 [Gordonia polyisoprenivorans]|nr:hypothetical protein [Gordonia polyisoprenivorans]
MTKDDTTTPPQTTAAPEQPAAETTPPETEHGEARKYRQRAQRAEASLTEATATLDRVRAAQAHTLAAEKLATPADLLDPALGGVETVADLCDDNGLLDADKVNAALDSMLNARPGLARAELKRPSPGTYSQGGQFASTTARQPAKSTWERVLKP